MIKTKPFLRITILSLILSFLLIYLGIKYHWIENFKTDINTSVALTIPKQSTPSTSVQKTNTFYPEILQSNSKRSVLESMNKEQIAEQCINLLSKNIQDQTNLKLATVNCVMSNYQETLQHSKTEEKLRLESQKRDLFIQNCKSELKLANQYTLLQQELLLGICVSDKFHSVNN